jgi:protein-S-isoprenylcysteine O-methyltransferase Ste14
VTAPTVVDDSRTGEKPRLTWKLIPVSLLFGVILPVAFIFTGKYVDRMLGIPPFPPPPLNFLLGAAGLLTGYIFSLGSIVQLYQAGLGLPWGDVDESAQSTRLVTTGLYRHTRNPMIFGTLCLLAGFGCAAQSASGMILFPSTFAIILYVWVSRLEGPALEERFGQEYVDYKKNTPFLFPRPWRMVSKKG